MSLLQVILAPYHVWVFSQTHHHYSECGVLFKYLKCQFSFVLRTMKQFRNTYFYCLCLYVYSWHWEIQCTTLLSKYQGIWKKWMLSTHCMTFRQSQEEPNASLEVHAFWPVLKNLATSFSVFISFAFFICTWVPIFTAGVSSVFRGWVSTSVWKTRKQKWHLILCSV